MKRIVAATFLGLLVSASGALAQQNVYAQKVWFGVYEVIDGKEIDDPTSPTGKRYDAGSIIFPQSNSDKIVWRKGLDFGFGYILRGTGQRIEIEEVYFLPDRTGRASTSRDPQVRTKSTLPPDKEHFIGWFIGDSLTNNPLGTWIIQIRHQNRVIAEQWFNVVSQ